MFEEVGKAGASVRTNSRHCVIQALNESRHDNVAKFFHKIVCDVLGELADAVVCSVANFGVRVLQMLDQNGNHYANRLDIVDVFSNLRKGHNSCMFVPPIFFVCHGVLD